MILGCMTGMAYFKVVRSLDLYKKGCRKLYMHSARLCKPRATRMQIDRAHAQCLHTPQTYSRYTDTCRQTTTSSIIITIITILTLTTHTTTLVLKHLALTHRPCLEVRSISKYKDYNDTRLHDSDGLFQSILILWSYNKDYCKLEFIKFTCIVPYYGSPVGFAVTHILIDHARACG